MKKSLLISLGVFLLFFAKIILDIILVSEILMNDNNDILIKNIIPVVIAGICTLLIYNVIQRNYPFVIATGFVLIILIVQPFLFYITNDSQASLVRFTTPYYLIFINILLLIYFTNLKTRLQQNTNQKNSSLLDYFRNSAATLAGASYVIILELGQNHFHLNDYYKVASIAYIIASFIMVLCMSNYETINSIIDNSQEISILNKPQKLITSPFFRILFICSFLIGGLIAINLKVFTLSLEAYFLVMPQFAKVLGFYAIGIGLAGICFERLLKTKLKLHFGIKASLRIFPIFIILSTLIYISILFFNIPKLSNDVFFICIIAIIIISVLAHYAFETIFWNRFSSFYQPIAIGIRNDFYIKSFGIPLSIGTVSFLYIDRVLHEKFNHIEISTTGILCISFSIIAMILLNVGLYRKYKQQLQLFLKKELREDNLQGSIFGKINTKITNKYKASQYVRFLNCLNLINPLLLRKNIIASINTDDNFKQRVALIKADQLILFELLGKLKEQTHNKYFKSSPNRDKIDAVIQRFSEIEMRMQEKHYVEQLSISQKEEERSLGGTLAYYSDETIKKEVLNRLLKDPNKQVIRYAITSAEEIYETNIAENLVECMNTPLLCNAAFFTLRSIGKTAVATMERSFHKTGQSERVKLRIIQLYGLIASEESVELLIKKLNEINQTIISASLAALSNCNITLSDKRTVVLRHEIEELCKVLVWNMSISIDAKKNSNSETLYNAIIAEINGNYDNLFKLLSILYDVKSIQLIRSNLFSKDSEQVAFALELATVLITDELRYLILPLMQPVSYNEIISLIKNKIPTERISLEDICYLLVQREFKWVSPYTKACAMNELAKHTNSEKHKLYMANLVNPDIMLAELASFLLKNEDDKLYEKSLLQLKEDYPDLTNYDNIDKNKRERLRFDIINFLQTVPEFSSVPGEILSHISSNIKVIEANKSEVIDEIKDSQKQQFFYVLQSGELSLLANNKNIITINNNTLISSIDLAMEFNVNLALRANKKSILYKIDALELIDLFTIYHQIPESIINNTQNTPLTEYRNFIKNQKNYISSHQPELLLENA